MSHLNSGFLSAYNSLADKHLAGYFNNTRIRRHLHRVGLITRSGSIVPEKEYRHRLLRRDHQRRIRNCLTQAIFHKVLDLERHHRIEIKRKLQDFARKEHVHKMKVQRSKRHTDATVPSISPRPPSGPRNEHARHSGPEEEQSESSMSPGSSLPNSAPRKRQRPVRLQPLYSNSTTTSTQRASQCCRSKDSSDDTQLYLCGPLNRETRRHVTMPEFSSGISPYRLPVINNYVTPIPPPARRNERCSKGAANGRTRGRSLRPTTAPVVPAVTKQDSRFHKTRVHSNASVTMTFYGKAVHLTPDTVDARDEVKVFQQHCGGENLCVYRGRLAGGEAFRFVSRRHLGFPFSLTFFLNGMLVQRLSSCCEFRHRRGFRLGGKRGQFGFSVVDGASPCYKCIIALGLDKKPTPPPKRLHRDPDTVGRSLQMTRKTKAQDAVRHAQPLPGLLSSQRLPEPHAMDTEPQDDHPEESDQKAHDDYEEDFEEEDERLDEEAEEVNAHAVVNGVSSCPSEEGRDSHSDRKEDKVEDCRQREDDGKGGYSDCEAEEEKAEEKKKSASVCSGSVSLFSGSRKEDPQSEAEVVKEAIKDNGVDPTVQDPRRSPGRHTITGEKPKAEDLDRAEDQPNANSRPESMTDLDSRRHDVHGSDAIESSSEESDSSMPSGGKEATKRRLAKPEKDTEAVTKETLFSSELEMSDSSSDSEEPPTTDPSGTPERVQTDTDVESVAVGGKKNDEEEAASTAGALNNSAVGLEPLEGELRTLDMGEEQVPNPGTDEEHPDMEGEDGAIGDRDLQAQEPVNKAGESVEDVQESENVNIGTDLQSDPAETVKVVKVGTSAGDGDRTDQMAEDSGTLTEAPGVTVQAVEEGKVEEHDTERGQKEDTESTASNEATASILEKQDMKVEDTGEEEEKVEKAEETKALGVATVTAAGIAAEHPAESAEMSNAEKEMETEQETTDTITEITDTVNGGAEMMDGRQDCAERENKEETETTAETPKDEDEEEGGGAQTETGDAETRTEMSDDAKKEIATEKEATEGVWETESSVSAKDQGLEDESKASELVEESEEKEEETVRDTETKVNELETEIKDGEAEVRYAEIGSTGEEMEETPVSEEPKSEIEEEQAIDLETEGNSRPTETNVTPATAQEALTLSEENLNRTEGTLLEAEHTGRDMKNEDTVEQKDEAVESSRAGMTEGTPGGVQTGAMTVDDPNEHKLLNEEAGGLEMTQAEANPASDGTEKDGGTETELPGDSIDVVKGDADMKGEEEQKVRAAVEPEAGTEAEESEVNIDAKGTPDESPGKAKLQENTTVVKSDNTGDGIKLKAEDESRDHATQLEDIEEPDTETPAVDGGVTECDIEGSEGKSGGSLVNADSEAGETANREGLGVSRTPGGAALEVESLAAESTAGVVNGRSEEEQRRMGENEETTAERKEAQEDTFKAEKSRGHSELYLSRSKTELRIGAKFPPPLIRRSGSYTLTIAREGLSLQTFAASDQETESPLAYVRSAGAITGNAFTASNQKLQHIGTEDK